MGIRVGGGWEGGCGYTEVLEEPPKPRADRRRLYAHDQKRIETQRERAFLLLGPSLDQLGSQLKAEAEKSSLDASRLLAFQEAEAILRGQIRPNETLDKLSSIEVMISYSNQGDGDRLSTAVQLGLQRQGMVVWRDKSLTYVKEKKQKRERPMSIGIGAGQEWHPAIDEGIAPSAFGVCMLTKESLANLNTFRFIAQEEIATISQRGKLVFGLVDNENGAVAEAYRKLKEEAKSAGDPMFDALPDLESVPQIPLSRPHFEDPQALGNYIVAHLGRIEGVEGSTQEAVYSVSQPEKGHEPLSGSEREKAPEFSALGVKNLLEALTAEEQALGKEWEDEFELKRQIVEESGMILENLQQPEKTVAALLNKEVFSPQAEGDIGNDEDRYALQVRQAFEEFGLYKRRPYSDNTAGGYNVVVLSGESFRGERRAQTFKTLKAARYAETNLSGKIVMVWLDADPSTDSSVRQDLQEWGKADRQVADMKLLDNQATLRVRKEDFEDPKKLTSYIALKVRIAEAARERARKASSWW